MFDEGGKRMVAHERPLVFVEKRDPWTLGSNMGLVLLLLSLFRNIVL